MKLIFLVCAGLVMTALAHAQESATQHSLAMDRFRLTRCGICELEVPVLGPKGAVSDSPQEIALPLRLADKPVTLLLRPRSLRAPNFRLLVAKAGGVVVEESPPAPATWRGYLREVPGSQSAASLRDGTVQATIDLPDGSSWAVQPLRDVSPAADPSTHVVYSTSDTLPVPGLCGTTGGGALLPPLAGPSSLARGETSLPAAAPFGVLHVAEIAFDADTEYFQLNGSSVANTVNDIEGILNAVDLIYNRDVGIAYQLSSILVRTEEPDPYTATDPAALLQEFETRWNHAEQRIPRDVAHLMTGKDLDGTVIGKGYIGVICTGTGEAFSLSQSRFSPTYSRRVCLTAHELGHNWNACHCDEAVCTTEPQPDCDIMNSFVPSSPRNMFGALARSQITTFRDRFGGVAGCLLVGAVYVDANAVSPFYGTPRHPFQTVADGVNGVPDGGRVIIRANTYPENLTINWRLTLEAEGGPVTIGQR